ncbi:portal protein [Agrobacterium phage Milano]|uniref:Portal protein n=1 Tax=Agrobacterium phage Milano TaxID=2557550 RepID=A0ACD6BA82_9CAUD|nr:Chain U, Portal protein, gp7 [Agrobacterium phage Milano]8FWB_V Chain V, Portal protein, gp7 [Agrobacterium phage Milano]8FWB_W Chain W, Portal protein, gp7 [Agrobacterium phage Milano]8FWB_X Chain X, Portal protein, gp7 [Agrobacterium phage Milano]8FWB_Y Chain Y, Portal protein, gp7 [Agrobacterium phage Milano]8FWB_Z Chain Z, Portal protein, gp7 [Agrobacterium phage Milano]8FWB_a Chain a, Portal protein, gp7 [Agrobacterium phage Milano]8FWB_b Chain b, Portal protein, gp7 [Agrobacterium p
MLGIPLLTRKAALTPPAPSANPAKIFIRRFFSAGVAKNVVSYSNVMAAQRAMEHPVAFRCLDKLGLTVQSVKWDVGKDPQNTQVGDGGMSASQRKALQQILQRPNPTMSGAQLRYSAALSWACFGRMAFKVSVMSDGSVNAIWPLGIPFLKQKFDRYGDVESFQYGDEAGKETIPSFTKVEKNDKGRPIKNYAFMIVKPSINGAMNFDVQNTPLQAIGVPVALYDALMARAIDSADGTPNSKWLVTASRDLDDGQAKEVKEGIEETKPGGDNGGEIIFIAGTDVKVQEMKNDLSDIHSKVPLDDQARTIAGNFGIPIALLGFAGADGSKFANNYDESRKAFFEDTIEPGYLTPLEDGFSMFLCGAGYRVIFDRDSIPALRKSRADIAATYDKVTFITEEEKREVTGWPAKKEGQTQNDDA